MCGIVGYVGERQAVPILYQGLSDLEYRGYDSCGIAVLDGHGILTAKVEGRLSKLRELLKDLPPATTGIGHTRWATHGRPSQQNAHPHVDCRREIALVHNGIIENHRELREELISRGHTFASETDTEVIVHLIEEAYDGDLASAVRKACRQLKGSYALAVISAREPGRIVAFRQSSPLVVGLGDGEKILASDIPAVLSHTRKIAVLADGQCASITRDGLEVFDASGNLTDPDVRVVSTDIDVAMKENFPHFMLKEIHEQPEALARVLSGRVKGGLPHFEPEEFRLSAEDVGKLQRIFIVACGTAYHASLTGKALFERLAGISTEVDLASEFRYREPLVPPGSLVIAVSQSGETADTLAAMREARARGARVVAVTNSPVSSLAREAESVVYQRAGVEIAVASTKAYVTQVLCLALLALHMGLCTGRLACDEARKIMSSLEKLPEEARRALELEARVKEIASDVSRFDDVFFIGRGVDYHTAMEGQLKLKEVSYIHAEAYAAGELKHGTLALIEQGTPVVAVLTDPSVAAKTASNVMEVKARGGRIISVTTPLTSGVFAPGPLDVEMQVPASYPLVSPAVAVIPLQLLAYYAALQRGTDIDKPRNLAKSVTVE
ncbi:MAG: glutamine--fructose-6-phosphate transaminase (isomerizing) [Firmicutes bacterium]|nr:glutamine--fructose-6-phosphate transaminase (isomerizing) [Candidatus Fermentithermobacillaceae bacterium]